MFERERFIEDCKRVTAEYDTPHAIREVVALAVSDPGEVVRGLGEPERGGIEKIYHADDLTIINVIWGPGMTIMPHNHNMWAVIGVYGGQEDNVFYQRGESGLEEHGHKGLLTGDTIPLGAPAIHAVTNPLDKLTAAIHVYGGDFFETPRSEWDPDSLEELPYNVEKTLRLFEESNARWDEIRAGR